MMNGSAERLCLVARRLGPLREQIVFLGGTAIRVISAPHFVAAKINAFWNRGEGDHLASHDLEDLVFVVDGPAEMVDEVESDADDLRKHLGRYLSELLDTPAFLDALLDHLAGQDRLAW